MLVPCFFELDEEKAKSQSKDAEITKLCICPTEGDRSAYYEMSQSSIKKNRNSILQLRQENKRLHKKLANALAVSKTGYFNAQLVLPRLFFPVRTLECRVIFISVHRNKTFWNKK